MDVSAVQILIVLVIALLVFGPKRLPELGRQVGRGMREMKRQMNEVTSDLTSVREEVDDFRTTATDVAGGRAAAATVRPEVTDELDDDDLLDGVVVDGADAPTSGDSPAR